MCHFEKSVKLQVMGIEGTGVLIKKQTYEAIIDWNLYVHLQGLGLLTGSKCTIDSSHDEYVIKLHINQIWTYLISDHDCCV